MAADWAPVAPMLLHKRSSVLTAVLAFSTSARAWAPVSAMSLPRTPLWFLGGDDTLGWTQLDLWVAQSVPLRKGELLVELGVDNVIGTDAPVVWTGSTATAQGTRAFRGGIRFKF